MSYPEYEDDVLKTLSLQFNLGLTIEDNRPTPARLSKTLRRAIDIGSEVDVLKRAVFYGSAYADPSEEPLPQMELKAGPEAGLGFPTADMIHSAMGIFTEAAEFLAAVYESCFQGRPFDATNAIEELGDLEWYMAVMRRRLRVSQEQVQRTNIAKLKIRYPGKFASAGALNRDLDQERAVLESSSK